jgi:beta-galactosidase
MLISGIVLVQGPYLVRGAKLTGSKLAITGDIVNATTLEVFAPKAVKSITWNGKSIKTKSTEYGSLKASLDAPKSIKLPAFSSWKANDSLPERFADYDDSGVAWVGKLLFSTRKSQAKSFITNNSQMPTT